MYYKLCMSDRAEIRFAHIARNDKGFVRRIIEKKPIKYLKNLIIMIFKRGI